MILLMMNPTRIQSRDQILTFSSLLTPDIMACFVAIIARLLEYCRKGENKDIIHSPDIIVIDKIDHSSKKL